MRFRVIALATVVSLAAAACSSSGGSDGNGNGKLDTITVDAAFYGPVDVPLFLAADKGYYAKQGLQVKFIVASSNTQLASVLGGSVQFASTSAINVIKAAQNGAEFVNFLPIELGFSEDVIMSKKAYQEAGLSASSSVQDKIKALAGKKLGVISATGENATIFKYMFNFAGVPQSQLNMVQLGTPAAIQAALKQGTIAGANVGSPYPAQAVHDGYAEYLFKAPLADIPPMSTAVTQTLATTRKYYDGHQDLIKRFLTAYKKGIADTFADTAAAGEEVYAKHFSDQPKDTFIQSYNEDLGIIAKDVTITQQQKDDLKKIAQVAGVDVSKWDDYFVTPPTS
jgi:NitT/TauT family transport system substrate-binding protein